MPCLIALVALAAPRFALVLVWIFSDYLGRAYDTLLWPLLGFFFLPLLTLAYAWAHNSTAGQISGGYLLVLIVAALIDLGMIGGGSRGRQRREG